MSTEVTPCFGGRWITICDACGNTAAAHTNAPTESSTTTEPETEGVSA